MADDPLGDPLGELGRLWRVIVYVSFAVFAFVVVAAFVDAEWGGGHYHPDLGIYTLVGSVVAGAFSVQVLLELLRRRKP